MLLLLQKRVYSDLQILFPPPESRQKAFLFSFFILLELLFEQTYCSYFILILLSHINYSKSIPIIVLLYRFSCIHILNGFKPIISMASFFRTQFPNSCYKRFIILYFTTFLLITNFDTYFDVVNILFVSIDFQLKQ